jgi:hypothetical protein
MQPELAHKLESTGSLSLYDTLPFVENMAQAKS